MRWDPAKMAITSWIDQSYYSWDTGTAWVRLAHFTGQIGILKRRYFRFYVEVKVKFFESSFLAIISRAYICPTDVWRMNEYFK